MTSVEPITVRNGTRSRRYAASATLAANDRDRVKLLERAVMELRRTNEILCKASAYFVMAECDRRER